MLDLPKLNPKFKAWFAAQSIERQTEILTHWDETAIDPEIAHDNAAQEGRGNGAYARAAWVVDRCIERHGFEP